MKMSIVKGLASIVTLMTTAGAIWAMHKLSVFLDRSAPLGYEDDDGFHFGSTPPT
jgi:hypothetical protein